MKKALLFLILTVFFCPFLAQAADIDSDIDGLSDKLELQFKTDLNNKDTDNDGYIDGVEIANAYNPLSSSTIKLSKNIEVELKTQKLRYFLDGVKLGEYIVSTGKTGTPTPKGNFVIKNKALRPKSAAFGLWMPYWLGLNAPGIGIHELPEWGKGIKEGASHLGKPVSHGCVRLGVGAAKTIYDFAAVGTKVKIY